MHRLGLISRNFNNMYRNKLSCLIRKSKQNYYTKVFDRNKNNLCNSWKVIRNLISKGVKNSNIKELLIEGACVRDELKMAEAFNGFFTSVGPQIHESINSDTNLQMSFSNPNSFFLDPVTPDEINSIIISLKNTKSHIDQLPVHILKSFYEIIGNPLCFLINESFCKGIFPEILKKARVTPIFKGGDSTSVNNYRPISILSPFSKIFERAFLSRLVKFISKYNLISPNQYGFMKRRSTCDALVRFMEHIYENLNNKNITAAIYLDLRKAFDCVHHETLTFKLEKYGLRGFALSWIRSYLNGRQQYVKVGNSESSLENIRAGVPQGSLLGPVLFILFINDIFYVSDILKILLYADDSTIFLSDPDPTILFTQINTELSKLNDWFVSNKLSLNVQKSCWMVFTNKKIDIQTTSVKIDDLPLKFCNETKSLGVIFDQNLSFKSHIQVIISKISKTIGIFYKIRYLVPYNVLLNLYYSLIYPYLIYCLLIWGGTFKTHLYDILLLQKKLVRIITKSNYFAHTDPLFHSTGILKITELYEFHLAVYGFKNRNEFKYPSHSYETRLRNSAVPSFSRLSVSQRSIFHAVPKVFNSLPLDVQNCSSLQVFKNRCKKILLDRYLQT